MSSSGISAEPPGSVRFDADDFAVLRLRKPMRRAEALQNRVLPKLETIVEDALDEVRATYGVDPSGDSIISRWPNFRPRRERELQLLYPSAFVGLGGKRTLGKWFGVARRDGKPVQILPFRLGVHFDADGLEVELHNDWLSGLDEASREAPLRYLRGQLADHEALFRSWRIRLEPRSAGILPSQSISRTIGALLASGDHSLRFVYHHHPQHGVSQAEGLRSAFVRMYPLYDSLIQFAKGDRPRLGRMITRLEARFASVREQIGSDRSRSPRREGARAGSAPPAPTDADSAPFDPHSVEDTRDGIARQIMARRGQKEFRDRLLDAHGRRCAVTGCTVLDVLEAAHIHPYRGEGTNHVTNGLLLRADLHTLFDCYLLAIDPDNMRVVVAPSIRASSYGKLHGRALRLRTDGWPEPSAEALRLRYEEFERTHGKTG